MDRDEIMKWFRECKQQIVLTHSNKITGYTGVAFDDDHTYRVSGTDMHKVLHDLRSMMNGTYISE